MKSSAYSVLVFLGALCLALCVALIAVAGIAERQQDKIQARQQALNRGLLGPDAQRISGQVLQDLALASEQNARIRKLLERHGYQVQQPTTAAAPDGDAKATPQKEAPP